MWMKKFMICFLLAVYITMFLKVFFGVCWSTFLGVLFCFRGKASQLWRSFYDVLKKWESFWAKSAHVKVSGGPTSPLAAGPMWPFCGAFLSRRTAQIKRPPWVERDVE